MKSIIPAVALLAFAGCTTPYPPTGDLDALSVGGTVSANPYPRGSDAFCQDYAQKTARNRYESSVDRGDDGFGARGLARVEAEREGGRAYQRCRAGRTN